MHCRQIWHCRNDRHVKISSNAAAQSVNTAAVNTKLSLYFHISWYGFWRNLKSRRGECIVPCKPLHLALHPLQSASILRHLPVLTTAEWRSWWAVTHRTATLVLHDLEDKISWSFLSKLGAVLSVKTQNELKLGRYWMTLSNLADCTPLCVVQPPPLQLSLL